jgi:ethanolamine utilization protein EutQ
MKGTFRLTCDGESYVCSPGDVLYVPRNNHIAYECDEKCIIFYAAYPHDWKKRAGLTFVPGIDPEDMGIDPKDMPKQENKNEEEK